MTPYNNGRTKKKSPLRTRCRTGEALASKTTATEYCIEQHIPIGSNAKSPRYKAPRGINKSI
jgi:hypothetical protein